MASETIYDHPLYYDILFSWDRSVEADFYHRTFQRCGVAPGGRILEVACGTGQVARHMARRGWDVAGFDSSPGMVAFLSDAAAEEGLSVAAFCADMTSLGTASTFAAAYNPMSSFRLLPTAAAAEAHLGAIAAALRPGGVYVLDMYFQADAEPVFTTDQSWEMARGAITVRGEDEAVFVNDGGVEHELAWGVEAHLRGYTVEAFAACVGAADGLRIESFHPETTRATGVSEFDVDRATETPVAGRAMVVLRRE